MLSVQNSGKRPQEPPDRTRAGLRDLCALPPKLPHRTGVLLQLDPNIRFGAFVKLGAGRGYRAAPLDTGLSAVTVNLRLAPIRRLAREMADDHTLDPAVAAAVGRITGVARHGTRLGNWLTEEQANDLLNAPDPKSLAGKRDRAILALLIGCGLRRAELLRLNLEDLQQREARWVLPDLVGKGNRVRTVTVPAGSQGPP